MPEIYNPGEDSYLMSETLEKELPELIKRSQRLKFLEIGSGSGIQLETALNLGIKKENLFGCDINLEAVRHCKSKGFNCVYSDLFSNVKGKFDVIVFNPPYLPLDEREPKDSMIATTGGKKGNEVIVKFLKQAKDFLDDDGKIFVITSSLSEDIDFRRLGYAHKKLGLKKLFFEELVIWKLEFKKI
ncbi:hypothetical protein COU59_01470 [Candidatus Pacearchaeota archaeon CG10_big_fil_rev_8_21_14_0_10_34_12]|nr:MAG: hypothetical protein COU59_01470 [Candidatus Pacearchaeota archaeon CG10_big_fil_rev_8_21_14_0_10_34_12]